MSKEKLKNNLTDIEGLHRLPSSANFILVETRISGLRLQLELLKQEQIFIRDCMSFPELGERYFRVAVKKDEQNERLINGLRKIYDNI
jgi:histidinol-phosphate/aromatic aminotransferase/cobyric acid decarboxylase-like protein